MSSTKEVAPRFRVGDWVSLIYGTGRVVAQVIEDRGRLGVNGRRLYRIRLHRDPAESDAFEVREENLEKAPAPDKAAVLRFLKEGGLVAILQSNLVGGRDQPRVWFTFTPRGDVTYTFAADRGVMGGAPVPFFALPENKVFTGKKEEVITFLTSMGLTRAEAEDVLRAVGTAP